MALRTLKDFRPPLDQDFLESIYPLPRENVRIDDFYRQRHADLPDLTPDQLDAELRCVQFRLDLEWEVLTQEWLQGRIEALRAEKERRLQPTAGHPPRPESPAPSKPGPRRDTRRITPVEVRDGTVQER